MALAKETVPSVDAYLATLIAGEFSRGLDRFSFGREAPRNPFGACLANRPLAVAWHNTLNLACHWLDSRKVRKEI